MLLMTLAIVLGYIMKIEAMESCPLNAGDWNERSRALHCQAPNHYHCLRNEKDQLTQECLPRVWVQGGMCPMFNSEAGRMDVYTCVPSNKKCPPSTYWSNALYLYLDCFENEAMSTPNAQQKDRPDGVSNSSSQSSLYVVIVIAVVVLLILVGIVFLIFVVKRRKENKGYSSKAVQQTGNLENNTIEKDKLLDTSTNLKDVESPRASESSTTERKRPEVLVSLDHGEDNFSDIRKKICHVKRNEAGGESSLHHGEDNFPDIRKNLCHMERNESQGEYRMGSRRSLTDLEEMTYSKTKGKILLIITFRDVSQEKIAQMIREVFNTNPAFENTIGKWKAEANEKLFVFLDLFQPDSQWADFRNIQRLLSDISYDAKENGKQFVLEIPHSIFTAHRTFFTKIKTDPNFTLKYMT